jgi:hypothetical protein
MRFFADYYALLDSWAVWASGEIEAWGDISHPPADAGPLDALGEVAALRPAPVTGSSLR